MKIFKNKVFNKSLNKNFKSEINKTLDKDLTKDEYIKDKPDWNFLIYKIPGHGLEWEMQESIKGLKTAPKVGWAKIITQVVKENRFQQYVIPEKVLDKSAKGINVENEKAIKDFLLNYIKKYPAKHYFISFEGHSKQIRKIITPIHKALKEVNKEIGKKIDILAFDSCFMGQAETINEFADVANYIAASEESVAPWIEVEKLVKEANENKQLRQPLNLGKQIVKDSGNVTQALYDTSYVKEFNKYLKQFGEDILNINDKKDLKRIRKSIRKSQHFYVPGLKIKDKKAIKTTVFHTVDIVDFIDNLIGDNVLKEKYPHLIKDAKELKDFILSDKLIKDFKLNLKNAESSRFDIVYPEKAHGLSIHLPWTLSLFDNKYTYFENSILNKETNWDKVVRHITNSKSVFYLAKAALSTLLGHTFLALSEL